MLTPTDYLYRMAVLNIDLSNVDGTLIQAADKVIIGGEVHTIVNVKPLSPAGLVVL